MPLLNYSTTVSVDKTLSEIQRALVKAGARSILVNYDDQREPCAVSFLVPTQFGERGFALPANLEAIWQTMTRQHKSGRLPRRFVTREQAARVGWRIIKDWLEAQLAIIETGMVTLPEVMLPYLTTESGESVYQLMERRQLALPAGGQ